MAGRSIAGGCGFGLLVVYLPLTYCLMLCSRASFHAERRRTEAEMGAYRALELRTVNYYVNRLSEGGVYGIEGQSTRF